MQKLEIFILFFDKNEREKNDTQEEFYTVHQPPFLVFF